MPTDNHQWDVSLLASMPQTAWAPLKARGKPLNEEVEEEMTSIIIPREGFTFGADPEVFVFDPDGKPVAPDMIPGDKANPHKVEHGAVQRDGFAAEFNIDPAKTFEEFDRNITAVYKQLQGFLKPGYTLQAVPSVTFDQIEFDKADDKTKELGCSPDHDAWTGGVNPPPNMDTNPLLRCAGGHIHIGWTNDADLSDPQHILNCRDLVKQLDWYLGMWSVKMDPDKTRKTLYGKAGACRFKDYGVEYRVLSNFWITTKSRRLTAWNRMQTAINDIQRNFLPELYSRYSPSIVKSINESKMEPGLSGNFHYPIVSLQQ